MSELLDALILQRKQEALDYKAYLAKIVELTKKVRKPESESSYPDTINSPVLRALYDNLEEADPMAVHEPAMPYGNQPGSEYRETAALQLDHAIRSVKKDGWRGMRAKRIEVKNAIKSVLGDDAGLVDAIYQIVESQRDY